MEKGDIVLINFPFTDLTGSKTRPAVVLKSFDSDVTVCFITSKYKWNSPYDIKLSPSMGNGLKVNSIIRVNKIATLSESLILGKLGELSNDIISELNNSLINVFQLENN